MSVEKRRKIRRAVGQIIITPLLQTVFYTFAVRVSTQSPDEFVVMCVCV